MLREGEAPLLPNTFQWLPLGKGPGSVASFSNPSQATSVILRFQRSSNILCSPLSKGAVPCT